MKQQNNDANPVLTENQNKKSRIKKILLWIGLSFISVILIVAIIVSVLVLVGKKSLLGFSGIDVSQTVSDSVVEDDGKTVFYNDKKYIYNENITAVLPIQASIILVILSIILTLIGGLIPSKTAAKKDPVIALRTE